MPTTVDVRLRIFKLKDRTSKLNAMFHSCLMSEIERKTLIKKQSVKWRLHRRFCELVAVVAEWTLYYFIYIKRARHRKKNNKSHIIFIFKLYIYIYTCTDNRN
jgi:hypothetical protein